MLAELLQEAMTQRRVVDLRRPDLDNDRMGWVVGIGPEWVLLHQVSDRLWLDGYMALRIEDISEMRWLDEVDEAFIPRALAMRELAASAPAAVDCSDTRTLIVTLGQQFPLVSLSFDRDPEPYAIIGQVLEASDTDLVMKSITPSAEWDPDPDRISFADVTTIVADAEYERALALVAGLASPTPG